MHRGEIISIDGRIQEHVTNKLKSFKRWKNNSDSCLKISQRRHCLNKYGRKIPADIRILSCV